MAINPMAEYPVGMLHGQGNLTLLDLSKHANMSSLAPGIFSPLSKLLKLNLQQCKLTELEPGIFAGLGALTYLSLANTELTGLERRALEGLSRLRVLNLFKAVGPGAVEERAFEHFPVVRTIRLDARTWREEDLNSTWLGINRSVVLLTNRCMCL